MSRQYDFGEDAYYDEEYDGWLLPEDDDPLEQVVAEYPSFEGKLSLEGGKSEEIGNISYNPYEFVSKCCKAFIFYDKLSIYCSKCGKQVDTIGKGQSVNISVRFNLSDDKNNASGDVLRAFRNSLSRFATDPTCELCEKRCPKCQSMTRYLRDCKGDMWFVCSNKDCRHIISPDLT